MTTAAVAPAPPGPPTPGPPTSTTVTHKLSVGGSGKSGSGMGATGLVLLGMGINTVHTVSAKKDPFPSLMAGGVFLVLVSIVASASPELGIALAALYLLSSFLFHGEVFVDFLTKLSGTS